MARLNVNPTRMELRRLKDRLKTAERGHKLLKDKSDEMVRQFLTLIRENKRLREEIEGEVAEALRLFSLSAGQPLETLQAIALPTLAASITVGTKNVMGVDVPYMQTSRVGDVELPYALCAAPAELDDAVLKLTDLADKLLHLAEVEKTCNMLADEIEKNRRRVNALEYVMIPQLKETIKYILMKLDENERAAVVRLMKVKDK
ncbi:MAG: V-type ATP synthase subunit D [Clostridia bacterium]|nr:V-type ATP synthase subunit D [Clostridia bacterium]MCI9459328.1 V-type ATP synthase subunit D [Clostridia bacterium]